MIGLLGATLTSIGPFLNRITNDRGLVPLKYVVPEDMIILSLIVVCWASAIYLTGRSSKLDNRFEAFFYAASLPGLFTSFIVAAHDVSRIL